MDLNEKKAVMFRGLIFMSVFSDLMNLNVVSYGHWSFCL